MKPSEVFRTTFSFVIAKCLLRLLVYLVIAITILLIVYGFLKWDLRLLITGVIFTFTLCPIVGMLFQNYFRYLLKVGHIAAVVRVVRKGKRINKPLTFGLRQVRKNFVKANIYFFVDRMIKNCSEELQHILMTTEMLASLGFLRSFVGLVQRNLLDNIDECCLSYSFLGKDTGPFKGAVFGIVNFVSGWQRLISGAVKVSVCSLVLTWLFYGVGVIWVGILIWVGNLAVAIVALIVTILLGTFVKSMLDSYIMVSMVTLYVQKVLKKDVGYASLVRVASMSNKFKFLISTANAEEPFLSDEEELYLTSEMLGNVVKTNANRIISQSANRS